MRKPEKIFVRPGAGRKVPLPIPGGAIKVPAEGRNVENTIAVQRLLRDGDLVEGVEAPATPSKAKG